MKNSFKINVELSSRIVRKKKVLSRNLNEISNIDTTNISNSKSFKRVI